MNLLTFKSVVLILSLLLFHSSGYGEEVNLDHAYFEGNEDAPILFIEYASQSCPYSADFRLNVFPKLREKYIDTGDVLYVSIPYVHRDDDMKVALYTRCAATSNIFPLSNELYKHRDKWAREIMDGKVVSETKFDVIKDVIKTSGLNDSVSDACLSSDTLRKELIAHRVAANKVGIYKTAQFIVQDKLYNELSWSDVDWLIQSEIRKLK